MQVNTNILRTALQKIGIQSGTKVKVVDCFNRVKVYLNNEYFGIFDYSKNTFVD